MNNVINFSGAVITGSNIKNEITVTQTKTTIEQDETIRILLANLEQKITSLEGDRRREKFLLRELTEALGENDRETMQDCCDRLKNCLSGMADIATILNGIGTLLTL